MFTGKIALLQEHITTVLYLAAPPATATEPPGAGAPIGHILGWLAWIGGAAAVAGLIIQGIRAMLAHRRGEEFNGSGIGAVLMGMVVVVSASSIATGVVG